MTQRIAVENGSGNVFADIGLPDPEERLAKADLAIRIAEAIRMQRLTPKSRGPHTTDREARPAITPPRPPSRLSCGLAFEI